MDIENLIGKRFGLLTVIALKNEHHYGNSWVCKCDCGNEVVVPTSFLLGTKNRRPNRSCGCSQKKFDGNALKYPRIYDMWKDMVDRCYKKTHSGYERFGAKGVTVCEEWKNDYNSFLTWALQNGYSDDLYFSRIDKSKPYEPQNCRFVDNFVRQENKGLFRNNKTGHTGVSKMKNGKFRAYISRRHKRKYLGCFDTLQEAVEARLKAEEEYKKNGTL
jgi:hypothetical protein